MKGLLSGGSELPKLSALGRGFRERCQLNRTHVLASRVQADGAAHPWLRVCALTA